MTLTMSSHWAKIAQVHKEGKREVVRTLPFYNLDMIISVGYRVNLLKATRFLQWATRVIKEYLLNGRAVNKDLAEAKKALAEHEKRLSNVELGVETIIHTLMPPIVNRKPDELAGMRPIPGILMRWRTRRKMKWQTSLWRGKMR